MTNQHKLGRIGVWSAGLRAESAQSGVTNGGADRSAEIREAVAELEELGYGTVWIGGSPSPSQAATVLQATSRITVATGILSIWNHPADELAARHTELNRAHGGRFLLGLGVSHSRLTDRYHRPYTAMTEYLDKLDTAAAPVPPGERVLAALGPRMLRLARDRAAGAHPYLVTAEHTAQARALLGPDALLAPEFKVVLDQDPDRARSTARAYLGGYLSLPNYANNLLRLGFTEEDLREGGSDRLVDSLFALGDEQTIRRHVEAFLAAGADHLAVQLVTADPTGALPREQWRLLADVLPLTG
ncbi:LLM class F420-dependent oxidoreductase [Streptomyces sp. TP-A0874]|uniref:LLM class F420-dependent oxidoreductase n=1 Tax=Streptomyces sp. TP-A0874 TaxID=549819 RepID=UPI000852EA47|nr:LLM class F420-dependent oxidoreductase [Streptomyces sp. TP-A0874]